MKSSFENLCNPASTRFAGPLGIRSMSSSFVLLDDQGRVLAASACPDERGAGREAEGVGERDAVKEHVG